MKKKIDIEQLETLDSIQWDTEKKTIHPALDHFNKTTCVGVYLPKEKMIPKTKKKYEEEYYFITVREPAIITSEKKVYFLDTTQKKVNEHFFRTIHADMKKWDLKKIQDFLKTEKEPLSIIELFNKIKNLRKQYFELDEDDYDLAVLYDIATYFHQAFNTFPFLFINATKGAGKTKYLDFSSCITFNSIPVLNMTPANLFRICQESRGTLIIDETDKFAKKETNDLRSLLLARYKKGRTVPRQEEEKVGGVKRRVTAYYEVYGPTIIANIDGVDDVLEDRTINITMKRTKNSVIANSWVDFDSKVWVDLRDELFRFLLFNYDGICRYSFILYNIINNTEETEEYTLTEGKKYVYRNEKEGLLEEKDNFLNTFFFRSVSSVDSVLSGLRGREYELWHPIFTIALYHSEELLKKMVLLAGKKTKEKRQAQSDYVLEDVVLRALQKVVGQPAFYSIKEICEQVNVLIEQVEGTEGSLKPREVGTILSRLGFKDRKRGGSSGLTLVYISPVMVLEMVERLGGVDEEDYEK